MSVGGGLHVTISLVREGAGETGQIKIIVTSEQYHQVTVGERGAHPDQGKNPPSKSCPGSNNSADDCDAKKRGLKIAVENFVSRRA